jgi:uncharacterized protein
MALIPVNGTPETAIIDALYAAISRNDIAGCAQYFDAEVERSEPAGHATAGTFRGREKMLEHLAQGRGSWAEGACIPEGYLAGHGKVIAMVRVHVRLKEQMEWIDGELGDVFAFSQGRITLMRTFWEQSDAIAWVESDDK